METKDVIDFIKNCPAAAELEMVYTDFTEAIPPSCGLHDLGAECTKKNIIGRRTFLHKYILFLRLDTASEAARAHNLEICRLFAAYIRRQADKKVLPAAQAGSRVLSMAAGSPKLKKYDSGAKSGLYELPFNITYEEM